MRSHGRSSSSATLGASCAVLSRVSEKRGGVWELAGTAEGEQAAMIAPRREGGRNRAPALRDIRLCTALNRVGGWEGDERERVNACHAVRPLRDGFSLLLPSGYRAVVTKQDGSKMWCDMPWVGCRPRPASWGSSGSSAAENFPRAGAFLAPPPAVPSSLLPADPPPLAPQAGPPNFLEDYRAGGGPGAIHTAKREPMQPESPIDYGYNQVFLEVRTRVDVSGRLGGEQGGKGAYERGGGRGRSRPLPVCVCRTSRGIGDEERMGDSRKLQYVDAP